MDFNFDNFVDEGGYGNEDLVDEVLRVLDWYLGEDDISGELPSDRFNKYVDMKFDKYLSKGIKTKEASLKANMDALRVVCESPELLQDAVTNYPHECPLAEEFANFPKEEPKIDKGDVNYELNRYLNARETLGENKKLRERRIPPTELPSISDYIFEAESYGFRCIPTKEDSKRDTKFVILKLNDLLEARLSVYGAGNYTIFTDEMGWEGLDLDEFKKDLGDLLSMYE